MSAYAIARHGRQLSAVNAKKGEPRNIAAIVDAAESATNALPTPPQLPMLDALLADLAERVAAAVVRQLQSTQEDLPEWLDSRSAAVYLGVHRDTLRKLAAERTIPAHQDGPGCKLFFRRADLDEWRRAGGRLVRLAAIANAA